MSLTSWLSRKVFGTRGAADQVFELHQTIVAPSHRLLEKRAPSRPVLPAAAQPVSRKAERQARRELLYGVVRDVMVRAEVLSASYRFKVLSLDSGGRQYIIMMDLLQAKDYLSGWLALMEAQIARNARKQHDITVKTVYWRINQAASPDVKPGGDGLSARQSQSR